MNIEQGLEDHMDNISCFCGLTLSIEERLKLDTELSKLKSEIQCDEIFFWGKIMGAEKDYYIAEALFYKEHPNFPLKKFYFCSSATFIFSELPQIQPHHIPDFKNFNTYFIGNPDIILAKYDREEEEDSKEDEEELIEIETYRFLKKYGYDKVEKMGEQLDYQDTTAKEIGRIIEYVQTSEIL